MLKIQILGKFFDNHSLSRVNRNLAIKLSEIVDVTCVAIDEPKYNSVSTSEIDRIVELQEEDYLAPDIQLRHSYPPIWNWPAYETTKVVYIQPWEFLSVPLEWQFKFETFADGIICPSRFNARAYKSAGLNPDRLEVIPNGYNPDIFYNKQQRTKEEVKVLYVGCDQYRKGLDILLEMWSKATSNKNPMTLTVKDTPSIYGKTDLQEKLIQLQYKTQCAKIIYDDSDKTDEEMSDLYNNHHILIHPYRGEGFGMHIQEAMACGCIPIVTEGGSSDDFVEEFKIKSTSKPINMYDIFGFKPGDSGTLMGQHRSVLEPNIYDLASKLKHVVNNLEDIKVNTNRLCTWDNVAQTYVTKLSELVERFDSVKRKE